MLSLAQLGLHTASWNHIMPAELILSLGIGSIMNVPVMRQGQCVGTMNVSGQAGQYGDEDLRPGRILAGLILPFVL